MKKFATGLAAVLCILAMLLLGCAAAEDVAAPPVAAATPGPETAEPAATLEPGVTPGPEDLADLQFVITGVDVEYTTTVPYSEFKEGKYTLDNLLPGQYTITEAGHEELLQEHGYTFVADDSTVSVDLVVTGNATATPEPLVNVYERKVENTPEPSTTPGPDETPTPTPVPDETPVPDGENKVSVPVVKIWQDNNNQDGNRPSSVTVRLLADGNEVAVAALSNATGWAHSFTGLPKYNKEGNEIFYTVTEDPVPMYSGEVTGFTVTNVYVPVTTSVSVQKIWDDNGNAAGLRPVSIYCTLSNGMSVTLSDANNWSATIDNLPTVVNGRPVTYSWKEQTVPLYSQTNAEVNGNATVFTNKVNERPEEPPEGHKKPPKRRGNPLYLVPEYGTPLGVEVIINHVGDCFD